MDDTVNNEIPATVRLLIEIVLITAADASPSPVSIPFLQADFARAGIDHTAFDNLIRAMAAASMIRVDDDYIYLP